MRGKLEHLAPENVLVLRTGSGDAPGDAPDFVRAVAERGRAAPASPRGARRRGEARPAAGRDLHLRHHRPAEGHPQQPLQALRDRRRHLAQPRSSARTTVGYACMPLFHSNSLFIGFSPSLFVGGSPRHARPLQRQRLRARRAALRRHATGTTSASPSTTCCRRSRSSTAATRSASSPRSRGIPRNRLRYAIGNGASPPDIDRFERWLGLEDMFELYGSTEAAISTFRRKGDPRGSVGEITDPAVKILDERGSECPPAVARARRQDRELRRGGRRDLPRRARDGPLPGLLREPGRQAQAKYRDGVYHSGDLGHVVERDGKRFLYFDGRTDDWIRKDGENFSAAQVGAPDPGAPRRRARRGLRRAVLGVGRAGDGGAQAAPRRPLRPRRRSSRSATRWWRTAAWTASGSRTTCAWWTSSSSRRPRRSWCGT